MVGSMRDGAYSYFPLFGSVGETDENSAPMQEFYNFFRASPRFKSRSKVVYRGDGAQNLS